ncbi:MAG: xylan 1,4-beta-xylosidase [Candidatus Dormiibacter spiritus]|nr:MAG: xylan 1,4-beta-xylosidase [Candidatus Dormibacteraeota bacterium]
MRFTHLVGLVRRGRRAVPVVRPSPEDLEAQLRRRRPAVTDSSIVQPPADLRTEAGRGQVTLRWSPMPGAAGYLVLRAWQREGPFAILDHGGGDVLAVPGCVYSDTTAGAGEQPWYSVAALAVPDGLPGPGAEPVQAGSPSGATAKVEVAVDAAVPVGQLQRPWRVVGSEHLSLLLRGVNEQGFDVGAELARALAISRQELGAERVRAHGIFLDELAVYQNGAIDFGQVDRVYDRVVELGLRPLVELSFMPRDLAANPSATIFHYGGVTSPPRQWAEWRRLVAALASHLVERYGLDEVAEWGFEVWNEPNLEAFWAGDQADYFRLYEESARALKSVNARLKVGGPATAAAGWIQDFAEFAVRHQLPVDFLSTHTYGNLPLDVSATAARAGLPGVPAWWTEWGVSPRHLAEVNDLPFGAPFVLSGMVSALERIGLLAYWVLSDHFEELGPPERLLHGGFGLLTVGNLRKPRFWALRMLELLGPERVAVELSGDGAGSLVQALATRSPRGGLELLVWNGTLDQSKRHGAEELRRQVTVRLDGLRSGTYLRTHHRVDADCSNVVATWNRLGAPDWPDEAGWRALRAGDRLEELEAAAPIEVGSGQLNLELDLPMPAASLIRLRPA